MIYLYYCLDAYLDSPHIFYFIKQSNPIMDYPTFNEARYSGINAPLYRGKDSSVSDTLHNINLQANVHKPQNTVSVREQIKSETVKSDSRIQYVPFEKKVFDYADEVTYKVVPKKRLIKDEREHIRYQMVPREVTVEDYYAVEYIRCYVPEVIQEKKLEFVPQERKAIKYNYIPVERQIIHYPQHPHDQEAPRYLGVRHNVQPGRKYENVSEEEIREWERQYGYVRGQPIESLNRKIQQKYEREKQMYFKQFEGSNVSTLSLCSSHQHYNCRECSPSRVYCSCQMPTCAVCSHIPSTIRQNQPIRSQVLDQRSRKVRISPPKRS